MTEVALAWANGNLNEAREKALQAIPDLPKQMDHGRARAHADWLEQIVSET